MPDPLSISAENAPAVSPIVVPLNPLRELREAALVVAKQRHPSTAAAALSRREQDRLAYLDCIRAAEAMRADARRFRDLFEDLTADPAIYGTRAKDYRDGIMARLEVVAEWCDFEASRMDAYAIGYRELVLDDKGA